MHECLCPYLYMSSYIINASFLQFLCVFKGLLHLLLPVTSEPVLAHRLREMVLRWLPVSSNSALEGQAPGAGDSPIKTVLRSKGFMWMSHSHTTAFYWSHAGQHFEIRDEGDW